MNEDNYTELIGKSLPAKENDKVRIHEATRLFEASKDHPRGESFDSLIKDVIRDAYIGAPKREHQVRVLNITRWTSIAAISALLVFLAKVLW